MALKGKPVAIGNTATTIYTCPATKEAAVHGLLFGNNTASALTVDVIVYNQATGSDVTVVTDLTVPANGVSTWSKPINLNAGDAVKAISSTASGMVCLYSTYEDGATPVASGFTARGTWSSGSTYAANDIVSVTGSGTYVAIQASTNQNPTTETAYWMFLEGISASALPVQAGNAGKYLTTDGTNASWGEIDSSSLSVAMDVNASGSVTQNTVVNFASDGTVGVNPTANSQSTVTELDDGYSYNGVTADGNCLVQTLWDDSVGMKARTSVRQSDGTYSAYGAWTTINSSRDYNEDNYAGFERVDDNLFVMWRGERNSGHTEAANARGQFFTVNSTTGAITVNQAPSQTISSWNGQNQYLYSGFVFVETDIPNHCFVNHYRGAWGYGYNDYRTHLYDFSNPNSITSVENDFTGTWGDNVRKFYLMSDNKVIGAVRGATFNLCNYDGNNFDTATTVTFDSSATAEIEVYRPSSSHDYLVAAFRNSSNNLIVASYSWDGSGFTQDSQIVVTKEFTGGNVASIVGDSTGFVVGYRVDSTGYVHSFEYDVTTNTITGQGIALANNTSNGIPYVQGMNSSDEFPVVYESAGNSFAATFTANSYNTVTLNPKGISTQTVSGGGQANVIVRGIVSGLSGLTQGAVYYYDTSTYDGTLTTTVTSQRVGTAISDTELLIDGL